MFLLLLALMRTAPPVDDAVIAKAGVEVPKLVRRDGCTPVQNDTDIVVCGGREANERYRLQALTTRYDPVGGPGIGFRLGKSGTGNAYVAQQQSPDGKPDKRVMVTVKLPF